MLQDFFLVNPNPTEYPAPSWDNIIRQASQEGVLPCLNHQITSNKLTALIPSEFQSLLCTAESLNAERNQTILAEAAHAAALLNQIGLQPVALKGLAYLLTDTYPNSAVRYLLDIDLLLPCDQIHRAFHHLLRNGYYQEESATFLQFRHHYPALCRPGATTFELHHCLTLGACNRLLPTTTILANARRLVFKGAEFLIPSPTDLVNHLILHSQLHHPYRERVFPPLKALLDLIHLQNRFAAEIDWRALARTYQDNGQSATLILHLHQAHQILGFQIPPSIAPTLPFPLLLRFKRRLALNRYPRLRFLDPAYLLLSLFSRRLRLLPLILRKPASWPILLRHITRPNFYRKLVQ